MGLRMALGALPREVMWLVLRRSMLLVLAGVVIGLLSAFAVSRVLGASLTEGGPGQDALAIRSAGTRSDHICRCSDHIGTGCIHCLLVAGLASNKDKSVNGTQVRVR